MTDWILVGCIASLVVSIILLMAIGYDAHRHDSPNEQEADQTPWGEIVELPREMKAAGGDHLSPGGDRRSTEHTARRTLTGHIAHDGKRPTS